MIEDVKIEGWKGKGDLELFEQRDFYRIIEKRKDNSLQDEKHAI